MFYKNVRLALDFVIFFGKGRYFFVKITIILCSLGLGVIKKKRLPS